MKTLQSLLAVALFALAAPALAQQPSAMPDVPEIAPAPAAKGDCEKCRQGGMGKMVHADMGGMHHGKIDGMACCMGKQDGAAKSGCEKCRQGGMGMMARGEGMQHGGKACCGGMGGGDNAALERRIAELEKRLDLMQQLLAQQRKR